MKEYVGIDLGGTNVRVGIVSEEGIIVKQFSSPSFAQKGAEKVTEVILSLLEKLGDYSHCAGIGIAVPGPVDKKKKVMTVATNLPGFVNFPLARILEEKTHLPTFIDNDANAAGLAEALIGAGKGKESVYYITHSTGIGGAFILNGKAIGGRKGYAGEIANIIVDRYLPQKNHLVAGAIENEVSGTALLKKAQNCFSLENTGDLFVLSQKHKEAEAIVDKMALDMAQLLATIAHVIDPEVFVIGGGVALNAHEFYFNKMRSYFRTLVHPEMADVEIELAQLPEPGIIGAALLAKGGKR